MDGIATGQGLAAAAWLAIALSSNAPLPLGGQAGNFTTFTAATLAALLGGLLSFLFFNWAPAKVFMGDGASGFLGFSFAALPLLVAAPTPADVWLKLNLGALALFPFLFDGTFTLLRRACVILKADNRASRSGNASLDQPSAIFDFRSLARLGELTQAHRSHLYQRWTQAGASHRKVASAYTAWAFLCGGTAVATHLEIISLPFAWLVACAPAVSLFFHSRKFPK